MRNLTAAALLVLLSAQTEAARQCRTKVVGKPLNIVGFPSGLSYDKASKNTWISGSFTNVAGSARTNIAGLDSNLSVLPHAPRVSGTVNHIQQAGDSLVIAGDFNRVGNFTSTGPVQRFDQGGKYDSQFTKLEGKATEIVSDGKGGYLVAGNFRKSSVENASLVQVLPDGTIKHDPINGIGKYTTIDKMLRGDQYLVTLSSFTVSFYSANGHSFKKSFKANHMLRMIRAVTPYKDGYLIAGNFEEINGIPVKNLAFIDKDLRLSPLNSQDDLDNMLVVGDQLFYTRWGRLQQIDLVTNSVVKLDDKLLATSVHHDDGKLYLFHSGVENLEYLVYDLATKTATKGTLPFQGEFESTFHSKHGITFNGLLKLEGDENIHHTLTFNLDMSLNASFNPDANGEIKSLKDIGEHTFIVGELNAIGGTTSNGVAIYDLKTSQYRAVNFMEGFKTEIKSLAVIDNDIMIGGLIQTKENTGYAHGMAKINLDTLEAKSFAQGYVTAMDVMNDQAVLGGDFQVGDKSCGVGLFNPANDSFSCYLSKDILSYPNVLAANDKVIVNGDFKTLLNEARTNVAAIDSKTGQLSKWLLNISGGWGWPRLYSLDDKAGLVYLTGSFDNLNGQPVPGFAVVDSVKGETLTFPFDMKSAYTLVVREDNFLVSMRASDTTYALHQFKTCQ